MKVMILATGKTEEHERCYAVRLIEQGRAVLPSPVAEKQPNRKPRRNAAAPAPEAAPDKRSDLPCR